MGIEEIVGLVLIFLVVVIPVLGFTARFALKPIGESILGLREALLREPPARRESARILELEEELGALRQTVDRLQEAREWDRALQEGEGPAPDEPSLRPEAGGGSPGTPGGTRGVAGSGGDRGGSGP